MNNSAKKFQTSIKSKDIKAGTVLIAQPLAWLNEHKYNRSVIIVVQSEFEGNRGLILNKQTDFLIGDAIKGLKLNDCPLNYGGDNLENSVSYIHTFKNIPEAIDLGNGLYFMGEFEKIKELNEQKQLNMFNIKFFAGVTAWSLGMIEQEVADKKWWASEITDEEVFEQPIEMIWQTQLLNNGKMYGIFNPMPSPSLN